MAVRLFSDVSSRVADPYLARAVVLASRARGAAWPNPLVGCVIVSDGRIVGEGFHPRAGEPHAEVFALADAGQAARGADVYVTLEPCTHHGRTPPCTEALIAAGVARVVIGMHDPNAEASGGAEALAAAGITVEFCANAAPFIELNAGWLRRVTTGMPFVTAKVAASLDARIAFEPGMRAVITGTAGALVTRRLRMAADAVLVSAATVSADDPALTVRDAIGTVAHRQPTRVILVRESLPHADARVFTDGHAPTLVLASDASDDVALAALPSEVVVVRWPHSGGLPAALRALGDHGVGHLLVEPGPRLLTALWEADVLDELALVSAGGMGGVAAQPLFIGGSDREGEALIHRMAPIEVGIVGDVSVTVWGPVAAPGEA